jgi:hypothetical protein
MATVGTGKHTYTLIQDWASRRRARPSPWSARSPPTRRTGLCLQRKDPPIVVFDRDGNYPSSWGNGAFCSPTAFHRR